jgi:sugar lactone lactonase YvrE
MVKHAKRRSPAHLPNTTPAEPAAHDAASSRYARMRLALIALLVILAGLLVAILVFVGNLITPDAPSAETVERTGGLTWVRSIYGASASAEDQLRSPAHTAIDPDGTIWVTDSVMNRVLGFNPDGSFHGELIAGTPDGGEGMSMLQGPAGIAASEDGEIYVASNTTDLVIVFNGNGEVDRAFEVPSPIQIAVRGDRVFVTSAEGLFLFTPEGEEIARWSSRGVALDQVDMPNGAVIAEDGTLYITDTHNAQVKAFSPDGELEWAVPENSARAATLEGGGTPPAMGDAQASAGTTATGESTATAGVDLASTLQLPVGMTMDGAGRLVFADAFAFAIYVVDTNEQAIVARYGDQGQTDGLFNYPTGIAYDPDRDWFAVADTANGRVQIVRIPDSGGSPLAAVRSVSVPWIVCAVPLAVLALAGVLAATRRRKKTALEEDSVTRA